jgi:hypothetical protein
MRLLRTAAPLLLLALTQCGRDILPPYATIPPPLTQPEQRASAGEAATRVAVCYNALTTTAARVRAVAAATCAAGTVPRPLGRDFDLAYCPIFEPARASFTCTKS